MEQEINLDEITDMNLLQNLLDQTEDIDDRKAIRGRIQELRSIERAKRDEKLDRLMNTREDMLKDRQKKAAEHKQRTLAMYDQMAKSAPAGGKKMMDIGFYQTGHITPPSSPSVQYEQKDVLIECKEAAENRKKKILAAYDAAARSAPAGATKVVDMEQLKRADLSNYQPPPKGDSAATFQMCGGIPKVSKGSQPNTPMTPGFPSGFAFPKPVEERVDPAQEIIRARQKEAEEQKKRMLAAYDYISKTGAGPKSVIVEELMRVNSKLNCIN
ncbi:hypothetical protein BLOT_003320 [Blomia tropicalis]|nr:hypothetical protein BLOT_003320 [Blomia tropicalis]